MWRYGMPVMVRGYYILVTDHIDFYTVCIREPRVSTNHRIILADLRGRREQRSLKYPRERDY